MPIGKKVVGLATVIAITTAINTFVATPAFSKTVLASNSLSSTYVKSDRESSADALEIARPILIGGLAALGLTAIGLATALLSGKNKEQFEAQIKTAKEIASVVKNSKATLNFTIPRSRGLTEDDPEEDLKSLVAELVISYHNQALSQAASQFWFSITAASIGFLLIMYMSFLSLRSRQPQVVLLNTLPGIAIEAVAALFFKQAEETRKRATELYDRLRVDDKQTQALALIETIDNEDLKNLVKAQWALQIVGLKSSPVDLSAYSHQQPIQSNDIVDKTRASK